MNIIHCPICRASVRRRTNVNVALECPRCGETVDVTEYLPTPREIADAARALRESHLWKLRRGAKVRALVEVDDD